MAHYDFKVVLEPDTAQGGYTVSCPSLPGCYRQGEAIDEALANIKEAIELCLEDMKPITNPFPILPRPSSEA